MRTFIWDRGWQGAYVFVAPSAEEAVAQWHEANPKKIRCPRTDNKIAPTVAALIEVEPNSYHITDGDC